MSSTSKDGTTLPFHQIVTSAPFQFYVGPSSRLCIVHSALIAHHSKAFNALLHGNMSEAKEGCARLEDVDEETFVRFVQWLYTQDYDAVEPDLIIDTLTEEGMEISNDESLKTTTQAHVTSDITRLTILRTDSNVNSLESSSRTGNAIRSNRPRTSEPAISNNPPPPPEVPESYTARVDDNMWGSWGISSSKKKKRAAATTDTTNSGSSSDAAQGKHAKRFQLWNEFTLNPYRSRRGSYGGPPSLTPDVAPDGQYRDYTETFLCHAHLYAFADQYDIPALKSRAVEKLRGALIECPMSRREHMDSLVVLLQFVYTNTAEYSVDRGANTADIHNLRSLVVQYAACVVELLMGGNDLFRDFLEEAGCFARDLVTVLVRRLD